jgi:hypothetical protein
MSNWHEMVSQQDQVCLILALLGILLSGFVALLPAKLRPPALIVLALVALSPGLIR